MRLMVSLALLASLGAAPGAWAQATIGGDWRADVARFAESLVEAGLTPGMGIAVSQGDVVLECRGFGQADVGSGRGFGEETASYIASSTKALTATAVVLLAERGVLDLDTPLTRYLPRLRLEPPLDADQITIRGLLTMTHGIEDSGPVVHRTAYTGDFTNELLIELLSGYGPAETGTSFNYGNLGYNILGLVIDAVDPEGWKRVIDREVLEPLGMSTTSAEISRLDPDRIAMPHDLTPDRGFQRIRLGKSDANLHAAGGHFATPCDLARFVAAHASGGMLEGRRIFPRAAIASTHEKHAEQDREFGPFRRFGWGYGWDLGTYEEKNLIHRFGSFAGYRSHMSFMPESGVGVVVLVNGGGPAPAVADLVATYIYDRLLSRPGLEEEYASRVSALASRMPEGLADLTENLVERRARMAPLPHPLEEYAGTYANSEYGTMEWRVVASGLEVRMGVTQSRAEVFDAAANQLRVELTGNGEVVGFEFPADGGPASALEYAGNRYTRVEPSQ